MKETGGGVHGCQRRAGQGTEPPRTGWRGTGHGVASASCLTLAASVCPSVRWVRSCLGAGWLLTVRVCRRPRYAAGHRSRAGRHPLRRVELIGQAAERPSLEAPEPGPDKTVVRNTAIPRLQHHTWDPRELGAVGGRFTHACLSPSPWCAASNRMLQVAGHAAPGEPAQPHCTPVPPPNTHTEAA